MVNETEICSSQNLKIDKHFSLYIIVVLLFNKIPLFIDAEFSYLELVAFKIIWYEVELVENYLT